MIENKDVVYLEVADPKTGDVPIFIRHYSPDGWAAKGHYLGIDSSENLVDEAFVAGWRAAHADTIRIFDISYPNFVILDFKNQDRDDFVAKVNKTSNLYQVVEILIEVVKAGRRAFGKQLFKVWGMNPDE